MKGVSFAAKTGTSRDGWFVGYTPNLVCVVWIGFDDNQQLGLTGAEAALGRAAGVLVELSFVELYEGQALFSEIVDWLLEDQLAVRFQLQMHKFIWPPEMKGV